MRFKHVKTVKHGGYDCNFLGVCWFQDVASLVELQRVAQSLWLLTGLDLVAAAELVLHARRLAHLSGFKDSTRDPIGRTWSNSP